MKEMPKHFVLLILILIATHSVKANEDSSTVKQFAVVESTHPGFSELLGKALGQFSKCLDTSLSAPENVLAVTVWVTKSAYTGKVDTNIAFELVPFFSWSDLDFGYKGVFKLNTGYVFLREEVFAPWIRLTKDSVAINQNIIGKYGELWPIEDTSRQVKSLPNYIYSSTFCKFVVEEKVFVESSQFPCECED